jgi:hypothetical protein
LDNALQFIKVVDDALLIGGVVAFQSIEDPTP